MSDLRLGIEDGDLEFVNGDLVLTSGVDAIRQHLSQRLQSFRGEWFLNLDSGVPYFQDIFLKSPNPMTMDAAIKSCILGTPGVVELVAFSLDVERGSRKLKIDFSADTIQGSVDFSGFTIG